MVDYTYSRFMKVIKKQVCILTAAVMAASMALGLIPVSVPVAYAEEAPSAAIQLTADYSDVSDQPLIRTEQYNNTNYMPLPVHAVDALRDEIRTKIVRDFVKINWYYEKNKVMVDGVEVDGDYLGYKINDPYNLANNQDLQHGRKDSYDFMSQFSESLMLTLGYSYSSANPARNRVFADENGDPILEMDWDEFDDAMYTIIKVLKEKNPKLEYMQVSNEPNLEPAFYGHNYSTNVMDNTEASYMRMYKGMSEAVVRINNELELTEEFQEGIGKRMKVGGPVLSGYNESQLKAFIDVAIEEDYQLDFVAWHRYQPNPHLNEGHAITIRDYLDSKGREDVITVVSEYGWKGGGGLNDSTNNLALAKQAAYMTDSAYFFEKGGTDIPMNWVAVHTLNAYFKNQFDIEYALSNGTVGEWQEFDSNYSGSVQFVNLRGWRESATVSAQRMMIQEIEFLDLNNNVIDLSHLSNDPLIGSAIDGDPNTQFEQTDYWTWLRFDFGEEKHVSKIRIKWGNPQQNKFQIIGTNNKLEYYELLGETFFTPYFNTMRMFSRLGDEKVATSGNETESTGVRLLATRNSDDLATMMVWNSQLDGTVTKTVNIDVKDLPESFQGKTVRYKKYLVDATHSNYAFNKRDSLEIVDQGTLNVLGDIQFNETLEPNAVMLIELEVVDPSINNIVSAFKTVTGVANPHNLVDGDLTTAAVAEDDSYPQEVVIDLGMEFNVTGAEIKWTDPLNRGYRYSISTSLDNSSYSEVLNKTESYQFGNSLDWFGSNPRARYVKLTVDSATFDGPLSIDDLNIFADAMYKNSFETAEERADINNWIRLGYGQTTTVWTTLYDSAANNYYTVAESIFGDTSDNFGFFGDQRMQDYGVETRVKVDDPDHTGNVEMGVTVRAGKPNNSEHRNLHYYFHIERKPEGSRAVLDRQNTDLPAGFKNVELTAVDIPELDSNKWYALSLEIVGNTLKGYLDGELLIEYTDDFYVDEMPAQLTSGKAGIRSRHAKVQFDDLRVYPIMPLLSDIQVNNISIPGFSPYNSEYLVKLPPGVDSVVVTGTVYGEANAVVHPVPETIELGDVGSEVSYTIAARSSDGIGSTYYTVILRKASDDATLSSLKLSVVPDFGNFVRGEAVQSDIILLQDQYVYDINVPSRTTEVFVIEAIPTASNLAVVQVSESADPGGNSGVITVTVIAEAGNTQDYTVNWQVNPQLPLGSILYEEDFESIASADQLVAEGWQTAAGGGDFTSHMRIVEEGSGKVLEKYTNENRAFTVGESSWTNYEVSARVKPVGHNALPGVIARADDAGQNFYMLRIHDADNALGAGNRGFLALGRVTDGSLAELGGNYRVPYPFEPGKWYQLRLSVNGSNIKGYVDDKLIFDVVDDGNLFPGRAPLTSGKAGLRIANNVSRVDDFVVSNIIGDEIDIIKPVITLNGQSEVVVLLGSAYTDAGAVALDDVDGDLTEAIIVTGLDQVDTDVEGAYLISYNVADSAGNQAETAVRTVIVVAPDKPFTISLDSIQRNWGLSVTIEAARTEGMEDHAGTEVVFFQLLKGNTPIAHVAVTSDITEPTQFTGHFSVEDPEDSTYSIHVFVVDKLHSEEEVLPQPLSNKLTVQ